MFRAGLLVFLLVGAGLTGFAQNKSRLDRELEALLQVHKKDRQAHFETDARKLIEHADDEFIAVSKGTIQRSSRADVLKTFQEYFQNAKYFEWDDLEPPIVRVSNDASMAWMIVRTRVRRTQKQADGSDKERSFVYAGIMTYEKKNGKWVRVANVSTFE